MRAHERRIGRIDAIDHVGQVFAIADRRIGGEGIGGKCHCVFLSSASGGRRAWLAMQRCAAVAERVHAVRVVELLCRGSGCAPRAPPLAGARRRAAERAERAWLRAPWPSPGLAPIDAVAEQELQRVVAQREIPLAMPRAARAPLRRSPDLEHTPPQRPATSSRCLRLQIPAPFRENSAFSRFAKSRDSRCFVGSWRCWARADFLLDAQRSSFAARPTGRSAASPRWPGARHPRIVLMSANSPAMLGLEILQQNRQGRSYCCRACSTCCCLAVRPLRVRWLRFDGGEIALA